MGSNQKGSPWPGWPTAKGDEMRDAMRCDDRLADSSSTITVATCACVFSPKGQIHAYTDQAGKKGPPPRASIDGVPLAAVSSNQSLLFVCLW